MDLREQVVLQTALLSNPDPVQAEHPGLVVVQAERPGAAEVPEVVEADDNL
jgi:hypothetical protein